MRTLCEIVPDGHRSVCRLPICLARLCFGTLES
jgi:hypothetical protein